MSCSGEGKGPGGPEDPTLATPEAMQESLEELAANVDDLVDRLTMNMTDTPLDGETESDVPTPPQPIAARPAEIAAASVETASEDMAEVEALADQMVDALTSTEEVAAPPPSTIVTDETRVDETPKGESEIDVEALAESMAKDVDLPHPAAPVPTPAAPNAEDEGEDVETLAERMVDGITASQSDEPQTEPEETVAATDEIDLRLDDLLVEDDPVVATEKKSETAPNGDAVPSLNEEPVAPAVTAKAAAQPKPREVTIPWSETPKPTKSRGGHRLPWKPLAAVALIGAVALGAWIFVSRNEPAVDELQIAGGLGAILEQAAQVPVAKEPSPAREESIDATEAALVASKPETAPAEPEPVAVKPEPAPSRPKPAATTPRPEPVTPRPAAVKPIAVTAKPKPTATAPVPTPVTPSPAATTASPPPAIPEPVATAPRPASLEPQAATPREIPVPSPVAPKPEPAAMQTPSTPSASGTTGPAEPVTGVRAPQLVSRLEPVYPAKARKRGEGGLVVLKVLVNDHGRVVRVVVEEGLPGSELEARAIDAALRSSYEPATENGRPVQAWVVERFVFEP